MERSYESEDKANVLPNFESVRAPGIHCDMLILRTVKELDFFQLYFTDEVISNIVKYTNSYAWKTIHNKKKYASADGSWKGTNNEENAIVKYAVDKTQLRVHSKCKAPLMQCVLAFDKGKELF